MDIFLSLFSTQAMQEDAEPTSSMNTPIGIYLEISSEELRADCTASAQPKTDHTENSKRNRDMNPHLQCRKLQEGGTVPRNPEHICLCQGTKACRLKGSQDIKDPALELHQTMTELLKISLQWTGWQVPWFMFPFYLDSMDRSRVWALELNHPLSEPIAHWSSSCPTKVTPWQYTHAHYSSSHLAKVTQT